MRATAGYRAAVGALWHPFADMSAVDDREVVIVRGEGVWLYDEDGRRYLDGASSLWYANVGHGRPEIREAIDAQLRELETFHVFGDVANRPALTLAERLASLAPQAGSRIFLTGGGGESIEAAVKLARLYHAVRGDGARTHIISRNHGYHGTNGIGTSIIGMPYREGYGSLVEDTSRVAHDSLDALREEIERVGPERVAAVVYEPVIGSGGVHLPPPGYLEGVEQLCRRHGILTVADVVIAGFGRIGTWFAVERFDLQPDLLTFAKGVRRRTAANRGRRPASRNRALDRRASTVDRTVRAAGENGSSPRYMCSNCGAATDTTDNNRARAGRAVEQQGARRPP